MNRKLKDLIWGMLGGGIILAIYFIVASSGMPQGNIISGQEKRISVQPEMPSIHQTRLASMPSEISFVELLKVQLTPLYIS